jgi:hypothetical protein
LFPGIFQGPLEESILRRAQDNGLVEIRVHDLRSWTHDRHRQVDDEPYGGGAGMVLKPEPAFEAVDALRRGPETRVIVLSPQGIQFSQEIAEELAREEHLIFLCGRYEGFDDRIPQGLHALELSIGDYVLTGGELPALVVLDAVVRLTPGFWETRRRPRRIPSRRGSWSTRSSPGLRRTGGWPCRPFCCRVTTRPSPGGGARRPSAERASDDRIFWHARISPSLTGSS